MCIILDVNIIPCIFNPDNANHQKFQPVLEWIENNNGKIVYGGTTYGTEASVLKRYFKRLVEFEHQGKAIILDKEKVDYTEESLKESGIFNGDFDDHHIVAIIIISNCRLILCSDNVEHMSLIKKSIPKIKRLNLCQPSLKTPRIYCSVKNKDMLRDNNIAICGRSCPN